jgi:hypothetical protein
MHVVSSFEFVMAPAMFQNPKESLGASAAGKLVRGRTKYWIGCACDLGSACTNSDRAISQLLDSGRFVHALGLVKTHLRNLAARIAPEL